MIYVLSFLITIGLLLRRSVQGSTHYSTLAAQFTKSEAKGRTLVLQQGSSADQN